MNEALIFTEHRHKKINPTNKFGPLFKSSKYKDVKDPCPVFDGKLYHIFGSGGDVRPEEWEVLHATSPNLEGPWSEEDSVVLIGMDENSILGKRVCAPGVIYDSEAKLFHMFLQTDFTVLNSGIEYLTSPDGSIFTKINRVLSSAEHALGIYDPHPFCLDEKKYIVYSATDNSGNLVKSTTISGREIVRPQPDVHLAVSESDRWSGPWKSLGKILDHEEIASHHNRKDDPMYEWGIEGPQIAKLNNGKFLLNATCFLPYGSFGTRQRVFFAISEKCTGPYQTLGPILNENLESWESGENGHAALIIEQDKIYLFYQARSKERESATENNWEYGIAVFKESDLLFT
ncbi:MAG: hypothetical protein JWN37_442 [Candidatus Nomurabacteria bacterium]|nr:hypothetical protein [Candidatus Nomurabacteria bacterium]